MKDITPAPARERLGPPVGNTRTLRIDVARKRADVLRCQYFIAEIYNRDYHIMFSDDIVDLDARIEPYPQRYLTASIDGELVGAMGLYTRNTYVERYGDVGPEDIERQLADAGVSGRYDPTRTRETTKLVVDNRWEGWGIARHIHTSAHASSFLKVGAEGDEPVLVVVCARLSLLDSFFSGRPGHIRSRKLKPFPYYEVHREYRTESDPMESRLVIPELDVPPEVLHLQLPADFVIRRRP